MLPLRRTLTTRAAAIAVSTIHAPRLTALRRFSAEAPDGIRRPKPLKVKKGEARRRVEPKPKGEPTDALVEQQEYAQAPAQYTQGPFAPQQTPQTFGGAMKESFYWGIGMAIAFTFVGLIFGRMEETEDTGAYAGSTIVEEQENERDQ